jgi:hypothetical protein
MTRTDLFLALQPLDVFQSVEADPGRPAAWTESHHEVRREAGDELTQRAGVFPTEVGLEDRPRQLDLVPLDSLAPARARLGVARFDALISH